MFSLTANSNASSAAHAASAALASASRSMHDFTDQWRAHRSRRVIGLLSVVVALSIADVALTASQISGGGMFEDNPLARLVVVSTGSVVSLIGFKALSLMLSMGLLLALRRHWQAEVGAWVAVGILVWLTAQWAMYLHVMSGMDDDMLRMFAQQGGWVSVR